MKKRIAVAALIFAAVTFLSVADTISVDPMNIKTTVSAGAVVDNQVIPMSGSEWYINFLNGILNGIHRLFELSPG